VLCSRSTDFISVEVKCNECLQRTVSERKNKKTSVRVMLLCFALEQ
jgi:hypothetical protein